MHERPPPRNNKQTELFKELCSYENLELAFKKARRRKTTKPYVIEFEANLKENLLQLQSELLFHTYKPRPLETFILREPKTRKISKSDFRDRVVHHAICNIIEPILEKTFIHDSYANRPGKGTHNAIKRFEQYKRKITKNNTKSCFVLKADIKHYFDTVDHNILLTILKKKIIDNKILWLISIILANHKSQLKGKGMPLGNLTSQFFANVYLNELDQFVKHKLRTPYYIRYVDDFLILDTSPRKLETYKQTINKFVQQQLALELHPDKSQIIPYTKGTSFLGLRLFPHHKLIRKKNLNKFDKKFKQLHKDYDKGNITREQAVECFEGWIAYVSQANTYKYRRHITRTFSHCFPLEPSVPVTKPKKHTKLMKKSEQSKTPYTQQKTLYLLKKGLDITHIAKKRGIKKATVWSHLAQLIEHNHTSVYTIMPTDTINKIRKNIRSEQDTLKTIKARISNPSVTFDEIACVLASIKCNKKEKPIYELIQWYQRVHCYRKCYHNKQQQKTCKEKLKHFAVHNPILKLKKKDFILLFNEHMHICVLPKNQKTRYISWQEFKIQRHSKTKQNLASI